MVITIVYSLILVVWYVGYFNRLFEGSCALISTHLLFSVGFLVKHLYASIFCHLLHLADLIY